MIAIEIKTVKLSAIKYACKGCGIEFTSRKACKSRIPAYCSMDCYLRAVTKYAGMTFTCEQCGIDFKTDSAYRGRTPKYCSRRCCGDAATERYHQLRRYVISLFTRSIMSLTSSIMSLTSSITLGFATG